MLVCSILNENVENLLFGGGIVTSLAYICTMEQKRQLPEDGVWRVVTVYYFRNCAILLSVSGYEISYLPWALSQK